MPDFVEQFLKSKLALTADTSLQIQRAHRALARKPERNQPPRSILVNFLEFNNKEAVLKKAWGKKIMIEGRRHRGYAEAQGIHRDKEAPERERNLFPDSVGHDAHSLGLGNTHI